MSGSSEKSDNRAGKVIGGTIAGVAAVPPKNSLIDQSLQPKKS